MIVEEWLGKDNDIGIDIWNKKYKYGNETFDEWLDRISNGDEELKQIIIDKKFLFAGRILSNRGLNKDGQKVTLSNCFLKGNKVSTKSGLKNIEDVQVGDFVLSHDGTWNRVNEVMSRDYSGDIYVIDSDDIYEPIMCTPNHKFLTQNGWKRADELIPMKDELKSPLYEYGVIFTDIDIVKNVEQPVYNLSVENTHTYVVNGVVVHNCYVISPPDDSIESIFECASKLARTYSYGGGCGIDISKLSPRGAKVNNTAKQTSGSVSFMDLYSLVTGLIGQNGRRKI